MYDESWLQNSLATLREQSLERTLRTFPGSGGKFTAQGQSQINLSSNDYLDLAHHPLVLQRAQEALLAHGAGATASRLVTGSLPIHDELERALAAYKGYPSALLFGSGYLANAGAIAALVGPGDLVAADRLVHASVVDAILLSRARFVRFRHNDAAHLRELLAKRGRARRCLIVTESLFSMDGDLAPLRDLARVAKEAEAMLMVDEAHATGIWGPAGAGLVSELNLQSDVDISMGTLSKALGSYGGFVAVPEAMRDWFVNRARALIYSTAPAPACMGAALGALEVLRGDPGMGRRLLDRATAFRERLHASGVDTLQSTSQIVPVVIGDSTAALRIAGRLQEEQVLAIPIREPTVPRGTARLRLSITLAHSTEDLERAADLVVRVLREERVPAT